MAFRPSVHAVLATASLILAMLAGTVSCRSSSSQWKALRQRGIDVAETVLPGLGHNVLFAAPVIDAVTDVLTTLSSRGK